MMRKLACTLILFAFLCSTLFIGDAHASTPISGIITSDTTWTTEQSPIQFTGAVCIASGVTVTVEPGVTVDFGDYYLQVNGTLNARGTSSDKIIFMATTDEAKWLKPHIDFTPVSSSWNDASSTGSIIENAQFVIININIDGCSPRISNNSFTKPRATVVNVLSGAPLITGNFFDNYTHCVSIFGSAVFSRNVIVNYGYDWGINCGDYASICYNKIMYCYGGISASGHANIYGNSIIDNKFFGIGSDSGDVSIQFNYICNDSVGIMGCGKTQYNTIINNQIGIKAPSGPINNNNIHNNIQNSVFLTSAQNIDATNNWWGTTDTQTIDQSICDSNEDFSLGKLNYVPFLTAPNPSAPSSPEISDLPIPPSVTSEPTVTPHTQTSQPPQETPNYSNYPPIQNPSNTSLGFDYNIIIVAVVVIGVVWIVLIVVVSDRRLKRKAQFGATINMGKAG